MKKDAKFSLRVVYVNSLTYEDWCLNAFEKKNQGLW